MYSKLPRANSRSLHHRDKTCQPSRPYRFKILLIFLCGIALLFAVFIVKTALGRLLTGGDIENGNPYEKWIEYCERKYRGSIFLASSTDDKAVSFHWNIDKTKNKILLQCSQVCAKNIKFWPELLENSLSVIFGFFRSTRCFP